LGYFPNAKKCCLIIKPQREQAAREVFRDTAINTVQLVMGHQPLGAALGSRSFLEEYWRESRQMETLFDVRVCHPNADSYKDLTPKQIYKKHEKEKKRQYAERVMEIEQGTFTPLVSTTTGGIADECVKYHSRLAELIAQFPG
ncbi:unnamed protein product, partial [Porites lobata]